MFVTVSSGVRPVSQQYRRYAIDLGCQVYMTKTKKPEQMSRTGGATELKTQANAAWHRHWWGLARSDQILPL